MLRWKYAKTEGVEGWKVVFYWTMVEIVEIWLKADCRLMLIVFVDTCWNNLDFNGKRWSQHVLALNLIEYPIPSQFIVPSGNLT